MWSEKDAHQSHIEKATSKFTDQCTGHWLSFSGAEPVEILLENVRAWVAEDHAGRNAQRSPDRARPLTESDSYHKWAAVGLMVALGIDGGAMAALDAGRRRVLPLWPPATIHLSHNVMRVSGLTGIWTYRNLDLPEVLLGSQGKLIPWFMV